MTTHPSPGAREIAEKHVQPDPGCPETRGVTGSEGCTCGFYSRVTALAQAIEEYGNDRLAKEVAALFVKQVLTGMPTTDADIDAVARKAAHLMPLFQEDANEVP